MTNNDCRQLKAAYGSLMSTQKVSAADKNLDDHPTPQSQNPTDTLSTSTSLVRCPHAINIIILILA